MPRPKRPRAAEGLMLEAASLFADGDKNYEVIAERLHIKPRDVKSLLEESVRWLLEKQQTLMRLQPPETPEDRLGQQLRDRFRHLQEVHIVRAGKIKSEADYAALIRQWGKVAAEYFDNLAEQAYRDGTHLYVGISGGETILETVNQLPDRMRPNVDFHATAMIGRGLLEVTESCDGKVQKKRSSHVGPETNATIAWARSGRIPGHCHYGTVPPYDPKQLTDPRTAIKDELHDLAENREIKKVIMNLEHLNVVFAGLGLVNPTGTNPAYNESQSQIDRLSMTGLLKPVGIQPSELAAEGAIGDLSYCLFNGDGEDKPRDAKGNELLKGSWQFFLTPGHYSKDYPGIKFYRQMANSEGNKVIVIAGVHKEAAILAALKGKLFNIWITDDQCARNILADSLEIETPPPLARG